MSHPSSPTSWALVRVSNRPEQIVWLVVWVLDVWLHWKPSTRESFPRAPSSFSSAAQQRWARTALLYLALGASLSQWEKAGLFVTYHHFTPFGRYIVTSIVALPLLWSAV